MPWITCPNCKGDGWNPWGDPCPSCNGNGEVWVDRDNPKPTPRNPTPKRRK